MAQVETRVRDIRIYVTAVALIAACGLVIEIVAGRLLAPYLGMSLYTWTAIIAVVLAGFSGGHWVGGRLADRTVGTPHSTVAWVLLFCALSTGLSLILIRLLSSPIINLGLPDVPTIALLTAALFFLPSFLVGIPSPILTKMAIIEQPERTGRTLGAMFAAGAFGSIVGTLAAGFLFISWLGSIGTVLLVVAVYLILGFLFFLLDVRRGMNAFLLPLLVTIGAGALMAGIGRSVLAFTPNCDVESDYYCIRVVDIAHEPGNKARVMILDHLGHGINVESAPQRFLTSYVELTDRLVNLRWTGKQMNARAYFVGGGAYTLPRAWLQRKPPISITVAEIDPMVTYVAMKDMWLRPDRNLKVLHDDARRHLLREPGKSYDVIIGDAFHDIAVPQHLVTREFFKLIKSRLRDGGFYVMTAVDKSGWPRLTMSLVKTLREVFPVTEVWIDNEQVRGGRRSTFILLAGDESTPRAILHSDQFPERKWRRLKADEIKGLNALLQPLTLTDDFAPVDRLLGNH